MTDNQPQSEPQLTPPLSRRKLLAVAGTTGFLALSATGIATALANDDDDDHRDDDDDDRDHDLDDHDDDDHDHDDDDLDDDDVVITGEIPEDSFVVRIVDDDPDGFKPNTVIIAVGESITFVNADDEAHTATGLQFDTGIMQPGETATVRLEQPGSYPFACEIHPRMTGEIQVLGLPGTPEDSTPVAATPALETPSVSIEIRNFSFEPASITIPTGATVTWSNQDQVPHTASGDAFDTGVIDAGTSASFTFTDPGEFAYVCAFHPNMKGTITVEA